MVRACERGIICMPLTPYIIDLDLYSLFNITGKIGTYYNSGELGMKFPSEAHAWLLPTY